MTETQKEAIVLTSMMIFRNFVGNKATRGRDWTAMILMMVAFHLMFTGLSAAPINLKSLSIKDLATYQERREEVSVLQKIEMEWSLEQRDFLLTKIAFHEREGKRTFEAAKEKCWWLPDIDYRLKARHCFNAAFATFYVDDPKSKLAVAVLTLLQEYGLAVMDEWDYINDKLQWSAWHYEQKEYYEHLLINECEPDE